MSRIRAPQTCPVDDRGTEIAGLGYTLEDQAILTIARGYFSAFADPLSFGWTQAIHHAILSFGDERGPDVAVAVLSVVQCMRQARTSVFHFNAWDCPLCAVCVTAHERLLMSSVRAATRRQMDAAQAHAQILCEGGDTDPLLRALRVLSTKTHPSVRSTADGRGVDLRNPAHGAGL